MESRSASTGKEPGDMAVIWNSMPPFSVNLANKALNQNKVARTKSPRENIIIRAQLLSWP